MKTFSQLTKEFKNIKEEYSYQYMKSFSMLIIDIIKLSKNELNADWTLNKVYIQHYSDMDEPEMGLGLYASFCFKNKDKAYEIEMQSLDNDTLNLQYNIFSKTLAQKITHFHDEFFTSKNQEAIRQVAEKIRSICSKRPQRIMNSTYTEKDDINVFIQLLLGNDYFARFE